MRKYQLFGPFPGYQTFFGLAVAAVNPLDVDFTALPDGGITAADFLTDTGLTFTRSTISTVQTSSSHIDATPGVNEACVGSMDGVKRGLVLQTNTRNRLGLGTAANAMPRSFVGGTGWTAGTATLTPAFAIGPDGVNDGTEIAAASGQFSPYYSRGESPGVFSCWQQGTDKSMVRAGVVNTPGQVAVGTGGVAWERVVLQSAISPGSINLPLDCRNWAGVPPGTAPTARTIVLDYVQLETAQYATEAIATGDTVRTPDVVSFANGASLVTSDGRLRFQAEFYPKFASTMPVQYDGSGGTSVADSYFLFSFGANDYAKFKVADNKLYVKLSGGVETVSTNAIAFQQFDLVEVYLSIGSNTASVAKYRVNNGAWIDLVLANIAQVPAPAGAVGMFQNTVGAITADKGVTPCWLKSLKFLNAAAADPAVNVAVNPATLALSGYWLQGNYSDTAGAGNDEGLWTQTASAGGSGGANREFAQTTPANVPTETAPGYPDNTVYPATPFLISPMTLAEAFGAATEGSMVFVVVPRTFEPDTSAYNTAAQAPYAQPGIVGDFDPSVYFGMFITALGAIAGGYDGVSRITGGAYNDGWQMVRVPCAGTIPHLIRIRFSVALERLELSVDNNIFYYCAFSTPAILTGFLTMLYNLSGGPGGFDGAVKCGFVSAVRLTDAQMAGIGLHFQNLTGDDFGF